MMWLGRLGFNQWTVGRPVPFTRDSFSGGGGGGWAVEVQKPRAPPRSRARPPRRRAVSAIRQTHQSKNLQGRGAPAGFRRIPAPAAPSTAAKAVAPRILPLARRSRPARTLSPESGRGPILPSMPKGPLARRAAETRMRCVAPGPCQKPSLHGATGGERPAERSPPRRAGIWSLAGRNGGRRSRSMKWRAPSRP